MASSYDTTCPTCGGKAHWNTDDGVTYCDDPLKCSSPMNVEYPDYKPPSYRGGQPTTKSTKNGEAKEEST